MDPGLLPNQWHGEWEAGQFAGFVHGARLTESQGLDVARFGQSVNTIAPSFGAFFQHEASVIGSGYFRITESPLRISIEATQRILDASHSAGINAEVPALLADLLQRAGRAGAQRRDAATGHDGLLTAARHTQRVSAATCIFNRQTICSY